MSRFRIFQTPVNQGFFDRPQRVADTFILYPRKCRFNCVTGSHRQEVRTITEYITADTIMPPFFRYPRFLLKMDLSQTAKLLYSLLLDRSELSQKNGWQDSEGRTYIVYPVSEIAEMLDTGCAVFLFQPGPFCIKLPFFVSIVKSHSFPPFRFRRG